MSSRGVERARKASTLPPPGPTSTVAKSGLARFRVHSVPLAPIVDALCSANADLGHGAGARRLLPSREALVQVVNDLRAALFPRYFGGSDLSDKGITYYVGQALDAALGSLHEQVRRDLQLACTHTQDESGECESCWQRASEVIQAFASRLPHVRALLGSDVQAAYEGDPAAMSADEAVFCYPGIGRLPTTGLHTSSTPSACPSFHGSSRSLPTRTPGSISTQRRSSVGAFSSTTVRASSSGQPLGSAKECASIRASPLAPRSSRPMTGRPEGPRHPVVEDDVVITREPRSLDESPSVGDRVSAATCGSFTMCRPPAASPRPWSVKTTSKTAREFSTGRT